MTLEELYQEINGNYNSMFERLRNEDRIKKFVILFLKDQSYAMFIQALERGDSEEAFRAIHTLKGVCMNLSFDQLYACSSEITEYLRAGNLKDAVVLLPRFMECYEMHYRGIRRYAEQ